MARKLGYKECMFIMKKYLYFNVSTEEEEVLSTESYQLAVRTYAKADRATLYGFTENGDCVVILSK